MAKESNPKSNSVSARHSHDIPVTAMLFEMEARITERMDARFERTDSDIHELKSQLHEMKIEINGLKADLHDVRSELHRVALLMEQQNTRNKYVMDGYTQIYELLIRRRN